MNSRLPLDIFDIKPDGMVAYLRYYGYHFSKKMAEWAVSHMRRNDPASGKSQSLEYWDKEKVESIFTRQGVKLQEPVNYDHVYVANMARADFYKSSITDEEHLALFIKDMTEDTDQQDGFIFNRFYADCCHNGISIPWSDMI